MTQLFDQSIEILQATNDGNKLAPRHLYLLQEGINGNLSEEGVEALLQLHKEVCIDKTYDPLKVYYFGVEHMTRDHTGYIYFKGHHIDHFSYGRGRGEEEKAALVRAQKICLLLEKKGHPIDSSTYCWEVEKYLTPEELKACGEISIVNGKLVTSLPVVSQD